jgi:IclR family pca regulon transcriptional regulator
MMNDDLTNDSGLSRRDLVAGLEKGLMVIEAFDAEHSRQTISEVAQRTGLTRAAARRYLLTLVHLGFMRQERKSFLLAPRALRLGQGYVRSAKLPRIVQPVVAQLAQSLQQTAMACVLDGDQVICVANSGGNRPLPIDVHPGVHAPAFCTATGRVLLAALPPEEAQRRLSDRPLQAMTDRTVTDAQQLREELDRTRQQGHAIIDQEFMSGVRTVAVPLQNHRGEVVAAINISAPADHNGLQQFAHQALPALLRTQAELRPLL